MAYTQYASTANDRHCTGSLTREEIEVDRASSRMIRSDINRTDGHMRRRLSCLKTEREEWQKWAARCGTGSQAGTKVFSSLAMKATTSTQANK